jgi:CelD/BcsL family acetyltransferase involved in cellulose biosynthesis
VQAWIDQWGQHPAIQLIDLGGRGDPLEHLYLTRTRIKKILPANSLCLAGSGSGLLSTPRAEYNHFQELLRRIGDVKALARLLAPLDWQQMVLPDLCSAAETEARSLARSAGYYVAPQKREPAYSVQAVSLDTYLAGLGSNTRLAYFNRRTRLQDYGELEFYHYPLAQSEAFFAQLNEFHQRRWGQPCYSSDSRRFMANFGERLIAEGGELVMQAMKVDGDIVSVLFDVIWRGRRYNFQSGYAENRFPKIALGALHMGYGIESAIAAGQVYDFMAGQGKHANYKEKIADTSIQISSLVLARGLLKPLYQIRDRLKN